MNAMSTHPLVLILCAVIGSGSVATLVSWLLRKLDQHRDLERAIEVSPTIRRLELEIYRQSLFLPHRQPHAARTPARRRQGLHRARQQRSRPRPLPAARRRLPATAQQQRLELPRQPQPHLPRSAAPLLTTTTVAFGTMPEATFIIKPKEKTYGHFHRNYSRLWACRSDCARCRASLQEIHPPRIGTIAIAATGGFDGTYTWGIVLAGVVGVAQDGYTLVNQAFDGKLFRDELE